MSIRGDVLAMVACLALGLSACSGAAGDEPAPPDRAATIDGCGPIRYDDVAGRAPSYLRPPLARTPNEHALCRGRWLPATGPAFVPQGLVVRGDRAWVSGYNHRRPQAGGDSCRVIVVDLRTGAEIAHRAGVARDWSPAAPSCQHAGGLALDPHGLWLAQRGKAWLLDPETLEVRRGWRLTGALRGSYLVTDPAGRIGFGGFHPRRSRPLRWFEPALLLEPGRVELAAREAVDRQPGPPGVQGAVWADLGPGPARVWFTRSTTRCGELWGGRDRRYGFLPGAEGIAHQDGRVWVVSEATAPRYVRQGGRPVVPTLAQYDVGELARWQRSTCGGGA
ncbi:hypothetical protein [Nocardioides nitrophenolicus]|uniref:hypothetical protein n=1 Tax=Nocardioides nitrophenolicus TaxID=60489 RepID=UPI00195683C5|nr:hypothetical protein [Nocardioides nitrophenolicus]MBM7518348.1 hypothetical protein [Nocardioides nitrophenolicus]